MTKNIKSVNKLSSKMKGKTASKNLIKSIEKKVANTNKLILDKITTTTTTNNNKNVKGSNNKPVQKTLLNYFLINNNESSCKESENNKKLVKNNEEGSIKSTNNKELGKKLDQYQLDLVNSNEPLITTCSQCSMKYTKIDPSDIKLHNNYHKLFTSNLVTLPKSKTKAIEIELDTIIINKDLSGKIISLNYWLVKGNQLKKVSELISIIGEETGKVDTNPNRLNNSKIYMFLSHPKRQILSFVITESIKSAYKLNQNLLLNDRKVRNKSIIGIHRIWTNPQFRGLGICQVLLNCIKKTFSLREVNKDCIAFYEPTELGVKVAKKFFEIGDGSEVFAYSDSDIAN